MRFDYIEVIVETPVEFGENIGGGFYMCLENIVLDNKFCTRFLKPQGLLSERKRLIEL